jgi:hypothetical protein
LYVHNNIQHKLHSLDKFQKIFFAALFATAQECDASKA